MGGKYPKGWPKSILFEWELRFLCHSISYQRVPVYLINQIIRYTHQHVVIHSFQKVYKPPLTLLHLFSPFNDQLSNQSA